MLSDAVGEVANAPNPAGKTKVIKFTSSVGRTLKWDAPPVTNTTSVFDNVQYWVVLADSCDDLLLFPPEVTQSALWPDLIMCSRGL